MAAHEALEMEKTEGSPMLMEANGLTVFRMSPEEVERLLTAQYGKKLVAVNAVKMEKRNQQREKAATYFQKTKQKKT